MAYTAILTAPYINKTLDPKKSYSECVEGVVRILRILPASSFETLEVMLLKGEQIFAPEEVKVEKMDLTSWITYHAQKEQKV